MQNIKYKNCKWFNSINLDVVCNCQACKDRKEAVKDREKYNFLNRIKNKPVTIKLSIQELEKFLANPKDLNSFLTGIYEKRLRELWLKNQGKI